jgi:hypothetical protein
MMSAATIHVQIIELVIGNPRTLKISGAAEGTFSSVVPTAGAGGEAGTTTAPPPGVVAGCAFRFTAKIAVKHAQINMMMPNRFTQTSPFSPHGLPIGAIRIAGLKGRRECLIVK